MRSAPAPLIAFLAGGTRIGARADLVTLTLSDGTTTFRWCTWPTDLVVSAVTYTGARDGAAPQVERGPYKQGARLTIDTLDLTLNGQGYTIGSKTLGANAAAGYFDGARVRIDHLIMPTPGDTSLGPIPSMFEGRVASVEPRGPDVVLRLKSELVALNKIVPRFLVTVSCTNAVYDANCALSKAAFTLAGTVSAATTKTITAVGAVLAKGAGYFTLGVLTVTTGGVVYKRAIAGWNGSVFTLQTPLPVTPNAGDAISVYPGCDKKRATCADVTKFNNLSHYRGYPHIPAPESGSGL